MLKPFSKALFRSPLQSLRQAYNDSLEPNVLFQEGLYLSSPEFWQELQKKEVLKEKEKTKLELSLAKYLLRSAVRCTPYGTFAGSSMVALSGNNSQIKLSSPQLHRRSLRLDMNYMSEIVNALVQIPVVKSQLTFVTNNSLYPASTVYRYAEYYIKNNVRSYRLTAVDKSDYLEKILYRAKDGAKVDVLASVLMSEENVSEEEAMEYITELWLSQLILPAIEPAVTGGEPLDQVISQLEQLKDVEDILVKLKSVKHLLAHVEEGVDYYKKIERALEALDLGIQVPKNTVQVDLFLGTDIAQLSADLSNEIIQQAEVLKTFASQSKNAELDDFKTRFQARYEGKTMPLSIVLDADMGIGYAGITDQNTGAGEWINDLNAAQEKQYNPSGPLNYLQQYSLLKYHDWLNEQKAFIEITEDEIDALKNNIKDFKFPNSMFLMGSLMKLDQQLDKEHFIFDVSTFAGPSAANILGRFTHGDKELCELTRQILEKEELEHPDAIYAEIAHLPQARMGNILLRPILRKYEIPFVGFSGIDKENQITVDDLLVSVQNGQIILFSKRLNKRVIPRLSTAHNFGYNSLPVYKFLCDLQRQDISFPNIWDWGHLSILKHLPRVIYKNLVLQKAVWKIEGKDVANLPKDTADYKTYFTSFCIKLKIPQRVVFKENDNELLIDLTVEKGIELFLHYLNRDKSIIIEEFLFTEENCIVHDAEGNPFTNEFIFPLYDDEVLPLRPADGIINTGTNKVSVDSDAENITRTFSPYSEWLYFKVYCGAKSAEKILATAVHPFIETGIENHLFDQFFFIRYKDESGSHFRIRFHNKDVEKQLCLFQKFMQTMQFFIDDGTIEKVMLDSYVRELERYIPALTEAAEKLFYHDSLAILRFLNLINGIDGEQYRMLFALRGVDMLLDDFKLSMEQKGLLAKRLQTGFFKEFGAHNDLQKQLNDRFRKHQSFFVKHFEADKDVENEIDEAVSFFNSRSEMNRPVTDSILTYLNEIGNDEKIFDLLGNYIHMYINRLYIAQQRKYELVVYHFLDRYYTSRIAIAKNQKQHALSVL